MKAKLKKICFFLGNANLAGGAERVSIFLANELENAGFKVSLLSLSEGDAPFFPLSQTIETYALFNSKVSFKLNYVLAVRRLRAYLLKNDIDVIIDVESILSIYSIPALLFLPIRHICWEHFNFNNNLGRKTRSLARRLAAIFASDVITLTSQDRQLWLEKTWACAKIRTIPNPIPFAIPQYLPNIDKKLVLAIGRLTHLKGFDILLLAWAKARNSIPKDWRLRIVGNGEEAASLSGLAQRLEIEDSVEFLPATKEIHKHYEDAAFYCLSSRREGLPMVLIEALSFGLPIVAFDCETGPREIVSHMCNGELVPPENIDALAHAISAMAVQPLKRVRYSESAKAASYAFCKENIVSIWVNLLRSA